MNSSRQLNKDEGVEAKIKVYATVKGPLRNFIESDKRGIIVEAANIYTKKLHRILPLVEKMP